jgi:hypothetical protein
VFVLSTLFSSTERNWKIYERLYCYQAARFEQILVTFDNIRDYTDVSSPMGDRCHVFPVRDVSGVLIYSFKCGWTNLVFINFVSCTHETRTTYLCESENFWKSIRKTILSFLRNFNFEIKLWNIQPNVEIKHKSMSHKISDTQENKIDDNITSATKTIRKFFF